jgi:hypothetical protein
MDLNRHPYVRWCAAGWCIPDPENRGRDWTIEENRLGDGWTATSGETGPMLDARTRRPRVFATAEDAVKAVLG